MSLAPPLKPDHRRQASDPLRGYTYQIWTSVLAWSDLQDDEVVYLESAEDIDRVAKDGIVTTVQVRDSPSSPLSLGNAKARRAVAHFLECIERNPERKVRYVYLTTAKIVIEKGQPFGPNRSGIQVWRELSEQPYSPIQDEDIQTIARIACGDKLPILATFVAQRDPSQIHRDLISRFSWVAEAPNASDVISRVERILIGLGETYGVPPTDAKKSIDAFLRRALDAANVGPSDPLTRDEFQAIFEKSTSLTVPRALVNRILDSGSGARTRWITAIIIAITILAFWLGSAFSPRVDPLVA